MVDLLNTVKSPEYEQLVDLAFYAGGQNAHVGQISRPRAKKTGDLAMVFIV